MENWSLIECEMFNWDINVHLLIILSALRHKWPEEHVTFLYSNVFSWNCLSYHFFFYSIDRFLFPFHIHLVLALLSPACTVCYCSTVRLHQPHVMSLFQITTHSDETSWFCTDQTAGKRYMWAFQVNGGNQRWEPDESQGLHANNTGTDCCPVGYMLRVLFWNLHVVDAASEGWTFVLVECAKLVSALVSGFISQARELTTDVEILRTQTAAWDTHSSINLGHSDMTVSWSSYSP